MRTKLYIIVIFAWLIVLGSPQAWAQVNPWSIAWEAAKIGSGGPALTGFIHRSRSRNADPQFVYEVLKRARRLQDRGLPTAPYLLKADEGLAKGYPPSRIQPALVHAERRTKLSGRWVDQAVAKGVIEDSPRLRNELALRYYGALMNGVSPHALELITEGAGRPGKGTGNLFQLDESIDSLIKQTLPHRNGRPPEMGPHGKGEAKPGEGRPERGQGKSKEKPEKKHKMYKKNHHRGKK